MPKSDSPRPGRPPEIDRDEIIDAAMRCLSPHRAISSLSLREIAREAGIAPNSFYRHFESVDHLGVALIERSGASLRHIVGAARRHVNERRSVIRLSTQTFFAQLEAEDLGLKLLLREGKIGPDVLREAVEHQLQFFEQELQDELVRLAARSGATVHEPAAAARAITRLVFTMGALALERPPASYPELIQQTVEMVRMIVTGAQAMATEAPARVSV